MAKQKPKKEVKETKSSKDDDEINKGIMLLIIIGLIAFSVSLAMSLHTRSREYQTHVDTMDRRCIILAEELQDIYGNYTLCMELYEDEEVCNQTYGVHCYYAQCPTHELVMEKTEPLCVCDVTKNQDTQTYCIRVA